MNCIVVDDDNFSLRIMSDFIRRTSYLTLVKTFDNAIDALEFIAFAGNKIQIIFLDIEMPEMSGMDFIRSIDLKETQVIIFSSHQKYALESYEYDVADYLLKPVNYARFIKAVKRATDEITVRNAMSQDAKEGVEKKDEEKNIVMLKDSTGELYRIDYNDIAYIEANENYVNIFTPKTKITIHSSLVKILQLLPEDVVFRTHRSYAIGKNHIVGADSNSVKIECGKEKKEIPIGKTYKPELKKLLISFCIA